MSRTKHPEMKAGSIVTWIDSRTTFVITKMDGEAAIGVVVGVSDTDSRQLGEKMGLDPSWEVAIAPQTVFELAERIGNDTDPREALALCPHSRPIMAKIKALSALVNSMELIGSNDKLSPVVFDLITGVADELRSLIFRTLGDKLKAEFRRDLMAIAPAGRKGKR